MIRSSNVLHYAAIAAFALACSGGGGSSDPSDQVVDSDGDGLSDVEEADLGLDPNAADSDGDGLDDKIELDGGSDPLLADTDADGLDDKAEATAGTDPKLPDTDNDKYTDFQEVDFGSDPRDKKSVIYQGGWPYNPNKEDLADPGFATGAIALATVFPDAVGVDQFGDMVHLYDYAATGKPILIDFSAEWCGPCNALADYLAGNTNSGFSYPLTRDAIQTGDVYWVTVLLQDISYSTPATQDSVTTWDENHPNKNIAVTAPTDAGDIMNYIGLYYFPTTILLNDDMTVDAYNIQVNPYFAAEQLEKRLAAGG